MNVPEVVEPDYETAAEAWMCLEMTKAALQYRTTIQQIAYEYGKRLVAEQLEREANK